jgi:hypothetical protein
LELIFTNTNYANVGDATGLRGSTVAGVFYISLHTANPNETGSQNTTAAITFPAATGGSETETHFGIGSDSTAAGNLFLWGALNSSLAVSNGITPSFAAGALDITLD